MRTKCGIDFDYAVPRAISSSRSVRLLGREHKGFVRLRSALHFYPHRVGKTPHRHRVSYVPVPIFHAYAMSLPYRTWPHVTPVPVAIIEAAEQRDELCDRLFVLWATEHNARVLLRMMRAAEPYNSAKGIARRKPLRDKMLQLYRCRLELQQVLIDSLEFPKWMQPGHPAKVRR